MHIDLEQAEKAIAAAPRGGRDAKDQNVYRRGRFWRRFSGLRAHGRCVGRLDWRRIERARTACFFTMGSGELGRLSRPGKPLYGIEHSNGGLITFPGALPIIQNGELFGAIGVRGSSVENDAKVAAAGCKVLGESQLADHHFARMMSLGA